MEYSAALVLIFLSLIVLAASLTEKLDPTEFQTKVLEDDRVWMLEFYSPMCGSCTEFAPVWSKIESSAKSVVTNKVNIDESAGMALAKKLGVLEEGLPGVRLFTSKTGNGVSIVSGNPDIGLKQIMKSIKENLKGLHKSESEGIYFKSPGGHHSRELTDSD